jgi:quinolinate synthase
MNVLPENCIQCTINRQYNPLRQSVVDIVNTQYKDAYVTAHLEVPGEMFQIALEKSLKDEGVVGSTSNILQFIERKVQEAAKEGDGGVGGEKKKFILGTEAGMVTSIARSVQHILDSNASQNVEAEIIFPVSSEAVMGVENDGSESNNNNNNTQR